MQPTPHKVVVYGMPRTATTAVQRLVSDHFKLTNLGEIGSDLNHTQFDLTDKSHVGQKHGGWCAKFFPQAPTSNIVGFWQKIGVDRIIVTRRKHLADAICSLHVAKIIGRYHHTELFRFPEGWQCRVPEHVVEYWFTDIYQPFRQTCQALKKTKIPVTTVLKEDFESMWTLSVGDDVLAIPRSDKDYLEFRIPYAKLVSNYDQIRSQVEDLIKL